MRVAWRTTLVEPTTNGLQGGFLNRPFTRLARFVRDSDELRAMGP